MNKDEDSATEILAKLGILNSTLESPNKMTKAESRRRAALNMLAASSSLSDDSDSEIIFDRNALLNARKRRRRQRSATRITNFLNNETLKWKLFCLSCTFLCMGLATTIIGLTKPDILANIGTNDLFDYSKLFLLAGFGYFVGTTFVSLVFTRLNAYICVFFLLGISIPFTTLIIYQTQIGNVKFFMFCQGLLFGAIERGSFFIVYGILKGDKRVLFMLYMAFAVGGALSSVFTTEEVFSRATVISQRAHLISKREIANLPELLKNNLTTTDELQAVTRPHSAIGIDEDQNTKTRENSEKRKQAQIPKEQQTITSDCKNGECSTPKPNTKAPTTNMPTTQQPKAETTQPPTTTHPPTTTTTTQQPTQPVTSPTFHRARNRLSPTTIQPQSIVDQMKDGLSEQMHKGLAQVNTAPRFAYVLIMIVSLITLGLLLIGFCCCIRCNLIADVRVAQIALDAPLSSQIPNTVRILSTICWFLQALPESILIAFLPHYILSSNDKELATQNNTAFFSIIFWMAVALFRAFVSICPYISMSARWIKFCYFVGIPFCFLFHHIFAETEVFIFAGFFALGFFMNSLPQLTFAWLQYQMDASPYLLTKYYFWSISSAKIFGPLLTVWTLSSSNSGLMTLLTVIFLLSLISFFFLSRSVNPLARQRQIFELTGDINGRRPLNQTPVKQKTRKGQYEALIENQSDEADVEMDYVMADNVIGSDSDSI